MSINLLSSPADYKLRTSSVLNRDTSNFGRQHLTDGREDTCWNSDQGESQWIEIEFLHGRRGGLTAIRELRITFQGGFAAKRLTLVVGGRHQSDSDSIPPPVDLYPQDNNKEQTFRLAASLTCSAVRILLEDMSDLFGRVIVYDLKLMGDNDDDDDHD